MKRDRELKGREEITLELAELNQSRLSVISTNTEKVQKYHDLISLKEDQCRSLHLLIESEIPGLMENIALRSAKVGELFDDSLENVEKFLDNNLIEREQTVSTKEFDRKFEESVAKLLAATFRLSKLREIFYVEQKSFELEVEMGVYELELSSLFFEMERIKIDIFRCESENDLIRALILKDAEIGIESRLDPFHDEQIDFINSSHDASLEKLSLECTCRMQDVDDRCTTEIASITDRNFAREMKIGERSCVYKADKEHFKRVIYEKFSFSSSI
jgi:hypothetical protein